jgi:hypothetical protein
MNLGWSVVLTTGLWLGAAGKPATARYPERDVD